MLYELTLKTKQRNEFIDITEQIDQKIKDSWIENWICLVYIPHTTCWITVNEWFDPDVLTDIDNFLKSKIPENWNYLHMEGNSDSHIKSSVIWASQQFIIYEWSLLLWKWQKVIFCDFDWPRQRKIFIKNLN